MNPKHAKDVLFEIDDILQEVGFPYTLAFGTCLGAFRHAGFIPWDPDIDFGCLNEDWIVKWPLAREQLLLHKFHLKEIAMPYDAAGTVKIYKGDIHIDFPSWFRFKNERWSPTALMNRSNVLPAHFMENTESIIFCGRRFQVPSPVKEYLKACYGPGWEIPAQGGLYPKLHHHDDYRKEHGLGGYDVMEWRRTGRKVLQ